MNERALPPSPARSPHQRFIARIKSSLRSVSGAFDLPSILVGVVVVGILTAGVLASIFGVIPFVQDNAAKQDATAARTAEGVAKAKEGRYMDTSALIAAGYLSAPKASAQGGTPGDGGFERASAVVPTMTYAAGVDAAKNCFVVLSKSDSGAMFYISDQVTEPTPYTPGMTTGCLAPAAVQAMAGSLTGAAPAASFNTLTWTPQTGIPGLGYGPTAMSADGSTILGNSDTTGQMYKSTDAGVSWTQTPTPRNVIGMAMTKDGRTFYATGSQGGTGLYRSTDAGASWAIVPGTTTQDWLSVALSDDGTRVIASDANGGQLWISSDSGATFAPKAPAASGYFQTVASSADGMKLVAGQWGGGIFTSADGGSTWVQRTTSKITWEHVQSSADGTKLVAADYSGYVFLSSDSGVTWATQTSLPSGGWSVVTISADGTKIAAARHGGLVYVSKDAGATWLSQDSLGVGSWDALSSSADGSKLIVGLYRSNTMQFGSWG